MLEDTVHFDNLGARNAVMFMILVAGTVVVAPRSI